MLLFGASLACAMRPRVHVQESHVQNPMEESDSEELDLDRMQAWIGSQLRVLRRMDNWAQEFTQATRRTDALSDWHDQLERRRERLRARFVEHDSRGGKDDVEEQPSRPLCGEESQEQVHMESRSTHEHSRNNTQGETENVSELGEKIRKIQPDAGPLIEHEHTRTVHTRTTTSSHCTQQNHQHTSATNSTPRSHNQQTTQQAQQGVQSNSLRPADSHPQSPVQSSNQGDSAPKNTKGDVRKKNDVSNSGTSNNSSANNTTNTSWSTETKVGVAGLAVLGVVGAVKWLPAFISAVKEYWYTYNNKKRISQAKATIKDDGIDVDAGSHE